MTENYRWAMPAMELQELRRALLAMADNWERRPAAREAAGYGTVQAAQRSCAEEVRQTLDAVRAAVVHSMEAAQLARQAGCRHRSLVFTSSEPVTCTDCGLQGDALVEAIHVRQQQNRGPHYVTRWPWTP